MLLKADIFFSHQSWLFSKYKRSLIGNGLSAWRRGVVVITTVQLHSTKPELRFSLEIRSGEGL